MDRKELNKEIIKFTRACEDEGYALEHVCLQEAYAGDPATSYIVYFKANWISSMTCYDVIHKLTGIMFETMSLEARTKVFSFNVLDENDEVHCVSGPLVSNGQVQETV